MKTLDITFKTPAQNLACDEALVDWCEEGFQHEILRFWEPLEYFVVLGYSNKIHLEINELSCQKLGIPVFRRASGGGTVLQGPGCLNFSLILQMSRHPGLGSITRTNRYIMERHCAAFSRLLGTPAEVRGITDLTVGPMKFSGNAQRKKRHFLLFHGTFLYNFDINLIEKVLRMPTLQPDYRQKRSHKKFLTNLNIPPGQIKEALKKSWGAREILEEFPSDRIEKLTEEKYSRDAWNRKF